LHPTLVGYTLSLVNYCAKPLTMSVMGCGGGGPTP